MRMVVKCPQHGQGLGDADGDDVIVVTGACGCRNEFGSGSREQARCLDHGLSEIVLQIPVGGSARNFRVLLACGCDGRLLLVGASMSLFRRKEPVVG